MFNLIRIVVQFFLRVYINVTTNPFAPENRVRKADAPTRVHQYWDEIAANYSKEQAFMQECAEIEARAERLKYEAEMREQEEILRRARAMTLNEWRANNTLVDEYFRKPRRKFRIV